jgi:hypothetical protein
VPTYSLSLDQVIEACLRGREWPTKVPSDARGLLITDEDRKAAWEFYVELVTRIATQLDDEEGVEATALESIFGLFATARQVMRTSGRDAAAFAALILALLNHRVRPFTAPWHKHSVEGRLADPAIAGRFREELRALQGELRAAADALALMAQVPGLTDYPRP